MIGRPGSTGSTGADTQNGLACRAVAAASRSCSPGDILDVFSAKETDVASHRYRRYRVRVVLTCCVLSSVSSLKRSICRQGDGNVCDEISCAGQLTISPVASFNSVHMARHGTVHASCEICVRRRMQAPPTSSPPPGGSDDCPCPIVMTWLTSVGC